MCACAPQVNVRHLLLLLFTLLFTQSFPFWLDMQVSEPLELTCLSLPPAQGLQLCPATACLYMGVGIKTQVSMFVQEAIFAQEAISQLVCGHLLTLDLFPSCGLCVKPVGKLEAQVSTWLHYGLLHLAIQAHLSKWHCEAAGEARPL